MRKKRFRSLAQNQCFHLANICLACGEAALSRSEQRGRRANRLQIGPVENYWPPQVPVGVLPCILYFVENSKVGKLVVEQVTGPRKLKRHHNHSD